MNGDDDPRFRGGGDVIEGRGRGVVGAWSLELGGVDPRRLLVETRDAELSLHIVDKCFNEAS